MQAFRRGLAISRHQVAGTIASDRWREHVQRDGLGCVPQVKMLLPKRRLKPRTFRAAEGQTVFVGGVARIDVHRSPGATLYLTVWASDEIACHFGKTSGAEERCASPARGYSWDCSPCLLLI